MLFSSTIFIFVFLPIVLLAYHLCHRVLGGSAGLIFLTLSSLAFYGWWDVPFLTLLIGSILGNFGLATLLTKRPSNLLLATAIIVNLTVLGYFKYRLFVLGIIGDLLGHSWGAGTLLIPLAISFFTFQQIAFLVNVRNGTTARGQLKDYFFFVSFFPQLIAGPIVFHREMRDQIAARHRAENDTTKWLTTGMVIFMLGLFKKVILADPIGLYADITFARHLDITMLEAWAGGIAFMLQLYFDFSGYSDMAVGLGLVFGFRLPANFKRPYRKTNMIEFWKTWHITMTRFFMIHVFTPISLFLTRRYGHSAHPIRFLATVAIPIFFTFTVSGLWHGASWSFVMFGVLVAIFLMVNHLWRQAKLPRPANFVCWLLTMIAMCIAFVYFRSGTIGVAHDYLTRMIDPSGFVLPHWLPSLGAFLGVPVRPLLLFPSGTDTLQLVIGLLILMAFALFMPDPGSKPDGVKLNWPTAIATVFATLLALGQLGEPQAFIYFQF